MNKQRSLSSLIISYSFFWFRFIVYFLNVELFQLLVSEIFIWRFSMMWSSFSIWIFLIEIRLFNYNLSIFLSFLSTSIFWCPSTHQIRFFILIVLRRPQICVSSFVFVLWAWTMMNFVTVYWLKDYFAAYR